MALLQAKSRIYPVQRLLGGMERVANSIVRVGQIAGSDFQISSTGWFITPSLVVVPGYSMREEPGIEKPLLRLDICRDGIVVWSRMAELVERLGNVSDPAGGLALLRVSEAQPKRVLDLSFDLPSEGAEVAILQYARGSSEVSVSFGQMVGGVYRLDYDADTDVGSSGAPVLDKDWRVVAMHVGSDQEGDRPLNYGVSRRYLLREFEKSLHWSSIASFHKIADDRSALETLRSSEQNAEPKPGAPLMRAALQPWIDRDALPDSLAALLRPLVADPKAPKWALRMSERRRLLGSAGSLGELRRYLDSIDRSDPAGSVVANILDGPPYRFEQSDEVRLSWWIQIARWFEGIAPDLPSPATISRLLERRRIRSRLEKIIEGRFRGRTKELGQLHKWYRQGVGPLAVTGIGGIGKSSLVARFASELDSQTPLLWLDFDRADLAPDDAMSVLSAVSNQAAIQLDGFVPPATSPNPDEWRAQAEELGQCLSSAVSTAHAPLIVLDSFEAAQYAVRYQELWPVLEAICSKVPTLKVCVTGRAPIPNLSLLGVVATPIELKGMYPDDTRNWLADNDISIPSVVERVVELAGGIPLIVRLAIRFIELGGRVEDLPQELPSTIVAGYLYDRILDRVQDPAFKPLASALLVLRRASEDMFLPLFEGLVQLPPGSPSDWFAELSREMGLVEGGQILQPRPEVRAATLSLLDHDNEELVGLVDERARNWYSGLAEPSIEDAAELVYHSLRLGDLLGAEQAWRDGVGAFLTYAPDEIKIPRARNWLLGRLGTSSHTSDLGLWEEEAAERIRGARKRTLDRVVRGILGERRERSINSPLLFHDALEIMKDGRYDDALALLERSGEAVPWRFEQDRMVLRASLWRRAGDRKRADNLLRAIQERGGWREDSLNLLTLIAARLVLSTDIEREAVILNDPSVDWFSASRILATIDVLSPLLRRRLSRSERSLEAPPRYLQIDGPNSERGLVYLVDKERARSTGAPENVLGSEWSPDDMWKTPEFYSFFNDAVGKADWRRSAAELALAGRRRWWIASSDHFLGHSSFVLLDGSDLPSRRGMAILGVFAGLAMGTSTFSLGYRSSPLSSFVLEAMFRSTPFRISRADEDRVTELLDQVLGKRPDFIKDENGLSFVLPKDMVSHALDNDQRAIADLLFAFSLVAPDPLDTLIDTLAGYP